MELKIQGNMIQGSRDYQEDYYEICTEQFKGLNSCLVVLCDGMGGHSGGALASHIVVTAFVCPISLGRFLPVVRSTIRATPFFLIFPLPNHEFREVF